MSYCPKCGNKVDDEMTFCPKCGAVLKAQQASTGTWTQPTIYGRHEKTEEKSEKQEKNEKHEKHEYGFMGPLVGGLILLFIGLGLYMQAVGYVKTDVLWALFFVLVGVLIIAGGIYGVIMAERRHPRT